MPERRDLLILGGGLVGMTLALAAARAGLTCHVVDRADPAELTADGADGRASAISTASWNLFTNIGIADRLDPLGCPIAAIAVTDGMKPGRIDFRPKPEEGTLGRMFANRDLRLALFAAAEGEDAIAWHTGAHVTERERGPHGVRVTLRDTKMYEFLERLVRIALPRIRDFKGIESKLDGRGNYTLGITEQIIFPEINIDTISKLVGMNITFVTTAKTDEEGFALLKEFGLPFKR